jgi:hypothetical protein
MDGRVVLVEGRAPSTARWRWCGDRVEVASPSGRVYPAAPEDVPTDVAIGLLALRDAQRAPATATAECLCVFALRTWLDSLRDPLIAGRIRAEGCAPAWAIYRFTFLAAASLFSAREGPDPHCEPDTVPEGQDHPA